MAQIMNNKKSDGQQRIHDLSFVPAHKREAIRTRIAVLEEFLKVRGRPAAALGAARLGIGISQFYLLAKAWENSRRPQDLAGANSPPAPRQRLTDEQRELIATAAADLPDGAVERVAERAFDLARERHVAMPTWASVRSNVAKALAGRIPPRSLAVGADVIVEHCAVNLGIEGHDGRGYMPIATIVTDVLDRRVLAVTLNRESPTATGTARAIADALRQVAGAPAGGGRIRLFVETLTGKDWDELVDALVAGGLDVTVRRRERTPAPDATQSVLGRRIQSITLHPHVTGRPSIARPARLQKGAQPVSLEEAEAFLRARWTGGKHGAIGDTLPADRKALADTLMVMAGG